MPAVNVWILNCLMVTMMAGIMMMVMVMIIST